MSIETTCPEAVYLTKPNIVVDKSVPAATVTAMEARARSEMAARKNGVAITGGAITQAK